MWYIYAGSACVSFSVMLLLFKQLSSAGLSSPQLLMWVYLFSLLLFVGHLGYHRSFAMPGWRALGLLALCGLLSYVGNYFQLKALAQAPNPGYAIAIVNVDAMLLAVFAAFFMGGEWSLIKFIGTGLCVVGATLMVL